MDADIVRKFSQFITQEIQNNTADIIEKLQHEFIQRLAIARATIATLNVIKSFFDLFLINYNGHLLTTPIFKRESVIENKR